MDLRVKAWHLPPRLMRMSRSPWNFGGGPGAYQAAASSLLGVTGAIVASRAARSAGRCR